MKQGKTQQQADGTVHDTTQSASGQHLNWVPNATAGELGALLPALFSTFYIFDGGVHPDIFVSVAPEGTQKETE